jgi:hypothetical protein
MSLKTVTKPLQNRYETVKIFFACGGLGQRPNLKLLPGARPKLRITRALDRLGQKAQSVTDRLDPISACHF